MKATSVVASLFAILAVSLLISPAQPMTHRTSQKALNALNRVPANVTDVTSGQARTEDGFPIVEEEDPDKTKIDNEDTVSPTGRISPVSINYDGTCGSSSEGGEGEDQDHWGSPFENVEGGEEAEGIDDTVFEVGKHYGPKHFF
eukprot:CAMPEP_0114579696 /NCGR_PEP_ID=MMETSP0125-20121206/4041_1 /TAXON_ID=485358 ORGANISM="Aristerostoma sp., Strain ATCC 50986" /NCGR_SAMPLE_ID=MMETSP0125 /ASSEMBLY_ACC=CAM_ASM_000245 /LENGTH=143 /DNA_ID=CAMNT_0001770635 /DNA_START=33 /DNA_END=464 /DNA_ORIENTATION=+